MVATRFLPHLTLMTLLLVQSAQAQQTGINWRPNLEAATEEARQTGKFVLAHFWTPTCGPCLRLENTVFNQSTVSAGLERQFVPVKIDASVDMAIARSFGVDRWPTDVVLTPEGQAIGKMISPPTPTAYISEVTQVVNQYLARSGRAFQQAVAAAPQPPVLNTAYAKLSLQPEQKTTQSPTSSIAPPPMAAAQPFDGRYGSSPIQRQAPITPIASATPATSPAAPPVADNQPMVVTNNTTVPQQSLGSRYQHPEPVQIENRYTASTQAPPAHTKAVLEEKVATSQAIAGASQPVDQKTAGNSPSLGLPEVPAGNPPLGFDGYCPVSMKKKWQWVKGDSQWGVIHRGRTYLFASQAAKDEFWQNPDLYSPALSGVDPVAAIDRREVVDGKREHSLEYDGQFYLFATEASLQQFSSSPSKYAAGVRQAMGMQDSKIVR